MKISRTLSTGLIIFLLLSSMAVAGDFDYLKDLNIRAQSDPSGFKLELATRFKIGDAEVNAVIGNVEKPADAYMVLRLAEMSQQPPTVVVNKYRANKGRGWGVLAKSLGIKPGSREFFALKRGQDLNVDEGDEDSGPGRGRGRGRGPR